MPPLADLPCGLTGWRPPLVRPSPPPCGWSIGFIAVPRTCGRRPSQRLRPALPTHDCIAIGIAGLADRRPASGRNAANFTAGQRNLRPTGLAGHQRGTGAGRAAQAAAAARLHFDVVNRHAQRNLRQRQAVADGRRRVVAAHHHVARLQTVRSNDVSLLAIDVMQQGDAGRCGSDRIGSNRPWPARRLCCGGSRSAGTLACDRRHDAATVILPWLLRPLGANLRTQQRLLRLGAWRQLGEIANRRTAAARRCRIVLRIPMV